MDANQVDALTPDDFERYARWVDEYLAEVRRANQRR